MKKIHYVYIAVLLFLGHSKVVSQTTQVQYTLPAILDSATIESQLDYIHERTRTYNYFRAIREDMFLKLKSNVEDSLKQNKANIKSLNTTLSERDSQIESLNSDLNRAKDERDNAIRTKDSFSVLGIQMNKTLYNAIMWFIILALVALAIILILLFKRNHVVTTQTKKELVEIQQEFEEHRKSSREKYEKLVVSHHNEIIKLKRS